MRLPCFSRPAEILLDFVRLRWGEREEFGPRRRDSVAIARGKEDIRQTCEELARRYQRATQCTGRSCGVAHRELDIRAGEPRLATPGPIGEPALSDRERGVGHVRAGQRPRPPESGHLIFRRGREGGFRVMHERPRLPRLQSQLAEQREGGR